MFVFDILICLKAIYLSILNATTFVKTGVYNIYICLLRRAVCANDASQPVARHFNSGSHIVSDMRIRALCPISGSNDSRKRHEMRLISKLGTLHPLGMNGRFSYI